MAPGLKIQVKRRGIRAKVKRILSHEGLGDFQPSGVSAILPTAKKRPAAMTPAAQVCLPNSAEQLLLWYRTPMGAKCFFSSCQLSKNWQRDCTLSGW